MRINHNITAMIANNKLNQNDNAMARSIERLSSGYRINRAADDAAGLAISQKMRTQIRGLEQAERNSEDGISVVQTAEGALNEIHSMLQRMKELTVQAANGSNEAEDRQSIQAEIDQMNLEIQRISDSTAFNQQKLLNGDIGRASYVSTKDITTLEISDAVDTGDYKLNVTQDARQAVLLGKSITPSTTALETNLSGEAVVTEAASGKITINGEAVEIEQGDTAQEVYAKLQEVCGLAGINVFAVASTDTTGDPTVDAGYQAEPFDFDANLQFVFASNEYGSNQQISISCSNEKLQGLLGISTATAVGSDVQATIDIPKTDPDTGDIITERTGFSPTATVSTEGNRITITDKSGFELTFEAEIGAAGTEFTDPTIGGATTITTATGGTTIAANVSILSAGQMTLQIGANEGQTIDITIPAVTPKLLGLDTINVQTGLTAADAIAKVDAAVIKISKIRSKLGAYQNRLEHTVENLQVSSENMDSSLSRIMDCDMAEEMTNYTQQNVLIQTATSMLSKANARPENVLQLLQQ